MTSTTPAPFEGLNTGDLMRRGLALTGQKLATTAALEEVRAELADRARAEVETSGTVPTWRVAGVGRAQLTDPQPAVKVTDEVALANWAAQREPYAEAVTATITVPAAVLERALEALEDAAVEAIRPVREVTLALAPKVRAALLEQAGTVHEIGEVLTEPAPVFDVRSGETIDGMALMPAAPRVFSLVLDAEMKKRAIAEGAAELLPRPTPPAVDAAAAVAEPHVHDGWGGTLPDGGLVVDDDAAGEPEYETPWASPDADVAGDIHAAIEAGRDAEAAAADAALAQAPTVPPDRLLFLRQLADSDLGAQAVGTLRVWCANGGVDVNERAPKPVLVKKLAAAVADAQVLEHVPAEPTTGS